MKINELLTNVNTVAITGHVRPDGDCVGSTLALYNYLSDNYPDIKADVYLEKPGNEFSYLSGFEKIITVLPDNEMKYDLLVVFDCGAEDRFEPFKDIVKMSEKSVCIDHHVANTGFADESFVVPDLSSTCELLYDFLEDEKISKETAECLYTGIICDTGIFKYQATTSKTMVVAGKLMDKGINHTRIIDDGFYSKTHTQNLITGLALMESRLLFDGKVIYSAVSKKTMDFYGLDGKQMGGVIDQLRNTEGTEVALFLYELSEGVYKVSMRARDYIDVSRVCRTFNGGGHVKAAGCNIAGTVSEVIEKVSAELLIQFNEYGENKVV